MNQIKDKINCDARRMVVFGLMVKNGPIDGIWIETRPKSAIFNQNPRETCYKYCNFLKSILSAELEFALHIKLANNGEFASV